MYAEHTLLDVAETKQQISSVALTSMHITRLVLVNMMETVCPCSTLLLFANMAQSNPSS